MTVQLVNIGKYTNDGTGDDLRTAFTKINDNFSQFDALTATNIGTGIGVFKTKENNNLEFKSLTSTSNSIVITALNNTVNLESNTNLSSDDNPTLSADLLLNGNDIIQSQNGGDVKSTVYGVDVNIINSVLGIMFSNNTLSLDMGTIPYPAPYDIDLKDFSSHNNNLINLDFGTFI